MQYKDLGPFQPALDSASGGLLSAFAAECERRGLEPHVYVLTHLEGLAEGEMKLCVHAIGPSGTKTQQSVPLGPGQHKLGWNLYLHERTTAARKAIERANGRLDQLDGLARPPETPRSNRC